MKQFNELGLSDVALGAVSRLGYEVPTPVQEQAIPLVLEGRDLIAAAKTGTGKTAAFALPLLDRLGRAEEGQGPLLLVVTPTRELARQIGEVCESIAVSTHHRILTVVGGVGYNPQIEKLRQGVDVLIATPGRLIDLMDRQAVRLDGVQALVLDEADRMLDMGFWPSVKKIVAATPASRQTLLFSATIDKSVADNVKGLLHEPALVEIAHKGDTADAVDQYVIHTQESVKPALLRALLEEKGAKRVIVFVRTRGRADSTCRRLNRAGFAAEAIHSSRSQNQRQRALQNFVEGETGVIVATDVLSRGIDVEEVDYVVNYDLPTQPEDYIHRIGRTGRAGHEGFAVSFATPETADALRDIEKLTKRTLPEMELAGFDEEAAEREAMAAAQRANAQRDPELRQAAKEEAARQNRKAQARGQTQSSAAGKGSSLPSQQRAPGGQQRQQQAARQQQGQQAKQQNSSNQQRASQQPKQQQNRQQSPSSGQQGQKGERNNQQRNNQQRSASSRQSSQQRAGQQNSRQQNSRQQQSAQQVQQQGSDLRPGRAHRADVARERGNKPRASR